MIKTGALIALFGVFVFAASGPGAFLCFAGGALAGLLFPRI